MRDVEMRAIFYGRVQGVCFRVETRQIAKRLGLRGTVRNVSDGSVEVLAQGSKLKLEDLISELKEAFAVTSVNVEFSEIKEPQKEFRVIA